MKPAFQPLAHSPIAGGSSSYAANRHHYLSDKNYEVIYLDNSLDPGSNVCRGNGSVVTLGGEISLRRFFSPHKLKGKLV